MSEGYSSLRARWESRMKESDAQSALASASPEDGDRKKPSSTGSIPPWKKSAQAAAAKAKAKESDGAGSLAAPPSTNAEDTATTPSWTRPSLTTHHAAETVEKYVASPSSNNDEASPIAAMATAGGGQVEIVEERSLSVSAAKSMFGGSVATSISGASSNDRAARWKAEAAAASAAVGDDDDYNVEEDRITSITVTDAKNMFDRPSASAATATAGSTSDAPSSRPKWLTGGGISGSPPSAPTGSGVPEAYAELFGVAHEYDKEKGTALGASGIIAEDEEGEEYGDDQGGRPAWLKGQSESGEEMEEEGKAAPQKDEDNTNVADDAPVMASEPVVADWLQAKDQDEVVKAEKMDDEADEPPPKKRGWGAVMKWLERKESGSGSDNNGSDKGSPRSQEQPGLIQGDTSIHEDDDDGAEIIEMDLLKHEDEDSMQEDPNDNIATVAVGAVIAGAGIATATAAATSAPLPGETASVDFASSPTPSVKADVQAEAEGEVDTTYEETFDDYAGGYDETEYYSEEDQTDYVQPATSSVPSARELGDEDYDENMGNDGSYSDRSTEDLEANLSSAYGLGAADNDDYYHDQDEHDEDDSVENLDDDTVQDPEALGDANKSYTTVDEDAPFSDQSAPQDGGGDWGEEEHYASEEHYADNDYPLYPHPSTDANEDAAGDKLYDYEDADSGYSNKVGATGDFSDEGSGPEDDVEDQEEEGYSETNYPDGDQPPDVQEESMFEENMNSEALNVEAGAVVGAGAEAGAAVSSDDYRDEDNSVKESPNVEDDDSSSHEHEAKAVAGAAALAAAATAGGIVAASTEEEVQTPVTSASKDGQYAPGASRASHGEETNLNAAPEPPEQYSEPGANSETYPEEKEEESGYDEYGDYYEEDMAAPIDFSNPPPEPSSEDPNDDDGYGQSNDNDGYYDETEQDGYYHEDDVQDDYYQSNEFPQDHQEEDVVAGEDEQGESGQVQGTYEEEEDQNNEDAYAAGGLVAAAAVGGGIAAAAATGDDTSPSNPVGPDKEPGDYGPRARSPSIRLQKSVVEEQRPRERLSIDAIVESESFAEEERDIELGYDEGFLPDEHLQNAAISAKASTSVSTSKRVSWDKDIDQDQSGNMKKWCIVAMIIVALGGIALGVSFSLSKRNNSSSDTQNTSPHEQQEIVFTQIGRTIAGPSRTFEYGPGTNGQFGSSLSLSGDGTRVAIGAPNYSASIFSQGKRLGLVQVFEQQNGAWTKLEPDIFGDLSGDAAGTSVSLSSDGMTLAVGSPEHLDAIFGGQVILYRFTDDGVWQQIGNPIIGDDAFDRLGTSVSLSDKGDRVAISQPMDEAGGAARKVAKVYEFQNDDWVQLGDNLVGRFGSDPVSMSGDGNVVALGSLSRAENDHRAAIRTYHYVNDTVGWKLKGSEIELEGAKGSSYDTLWMPTLSTDGNILAIGSAIETFSKTENPNEQQVLQVLAYQFDEELDDWTEIPVNTNLDMQGFDLSRFSTTLSGDGRELVVGDSGAGIIEILHLSDDVGAYMPVKGNIELKGADGSDDAFGYSVAVSSDGIYLASGAPQQVVAGEPVGSVSVFRMETT